MIFFVTDGECKKMNLRVCGNVYLGSMLEVVSSCSVYFKQRVNDWTYTSVEVDDMAIATLKFCRCAVKGTYTLRTPPSLE